MAFLPVTTKGLNRKGAIDDSETIPYRNIIGPLIGRSIHPAL